ncbi:MBL fold metallo-hydrolase [Christiangramia sp. LLG6405-1]|uniref:MBL fold metallo-hydrolase n=1 Tax=Christiangramia sp. LLG6405-1 TaxID=3160832 RepID=UPI0038641056
MIIILAIILVIGVGIFLFLNTERFGKHPSGDRLARMENSPNYREGSFQNLKDTPMLTEGVSYIKVLSDFLFSASPEEPSEIPTVKTDLMNLQRDEDVLVWMGHSSYFMQVDGIKILVDPVFGGNASPISFTTKAFEGTDIYSVEDIPEIDYLFLSHDHWDHMDYRTLKKLNPKTKKVITGLGNGAHLEHWGYDSEKILEGDWYESFELEDDFRVDILPARHFSGRGLKGGQTLWASFILKTSQSTIYIGGDSGYDDHFKVIGEKYGPIDLAILENGQYDQNWKYIHMLPGEQMKAAKDLNASTVFPVHSGKFTLANHAWNEPLETISVDAEKSEIRLITPKIGELVDLKDKGQKFEKWWNF